MQHQASLPKKPAIEVRDLSIEFPMLNGTIHAVNHVDFALPEQTITALVGESGSGKSTLATAMLNMISSPGIITSGQIFYQAKDVLKLGPRLLREYRWQQVSMVFQSAQNALNPLLTVREQMRETIFAHAGERKPGEEEINAILVRLMDHVRLEPERVLNCFPHELSGGMKQRVMIAFALLLQPKLIILDEPSTALDVITQDYIFTILQQIHEEMKISMLLLTHDIAVVAKVAQRVCVMYAGNIIEYGDVFSIFDDPKHEYTRVLIESAPSLVGELYERKGYTGSPPDLVHLARGCPYLPRCGAPCPCCGTEKPVSVQVGPDHFVACHRYAGKEGRE